MAVPRERMSRRRCIDSCWPWDSSNGDMIGKFRHGDVRTLGTTLARSGSRPFPHSTIDEILHRPTKFADVSRARLAGRDAASTAPPPAKVPHHLAPVVA